MKIVLAGLELEKVHGNFEETKGLALAANHEILGEIIQKRRTPHPATFFGEGKLQELKAIIQETKAEGCMIANEITPSQMRTLKEMLGVIVFDRNDCILQIFGVRAKTKQAKLQVELATLKHELPFVIHTEQNFSRMSGGKNKGEGEKQYQLDRRKYEIRIQRVEKQLREMKASSATRKKKRTSSGLKMIALAGYTNAGKSTLMNQMLKQCQKKEEKEVFVKDMLFATLDTSVRRISYKESEFLLSDTVGFVSDLPHELMDAFHSTLEEVMNADLILQVVDESDPDRFDHMKVTSLTLKKLEADNIPMWIIHNKCDAAEFRKNEKDHFYISAQSGKGIDELLEAINQMITKDTIVLKLNIDYEDQNAMKLIYRYGKILHQQEFENGMEILMETNRMNEFRFKSYVKYEKISQEKKTDCENMNE